MSPRQDFYKRFKPETFSFKSPRDLEKVYSFYLQKLVRRSVKNNLNPVKILTPHEFSVLLSLEAREVKEEGDFLAGRMYIDIYDFILYVSNPRIEIVTERLNNEDQEIYQNIFNGNDFAGYLRPTDTLREIEDIKSNFQPELSIRELQAKKWDKIINQMLSKIKERIRDAAFPAEMYIDDHVLYVLPVESDPFTITDLRKAKLETVDLQGRNHVILGDIDVNADIPEDLEYLRELSDLYGEDIVRNLRYVDTVGNELTNFEL